MTYEENLTTELKREYTPTIIKSVIAFANTNGGTIYIGIEDDGSVIGVDNTDDLMLRVMNAVRDSVRPDVTLFINCEIKKINDKSIMEIQVQKGTKSPYYLVGKGIRPEGVFIRQGAASVPATETVIFRMIKESDGSQYEDTRSLVQDLTFVEAEKEFKERNVPFGTNQLRTMNILNEDGLYTNLGLLISDQCLHTIKMAVFDGDRKSSFQDRREFTGSLLKQLTDAFSFIQRYNKRRSKIQGLHRIDKWDYPVEAIREALLNALVHRDYSFSGSTLISIFEDRIEFVSIGGLVKGISYKDIMLGISITRNQHLADIFYRLTLIEAYGTGLPKILQCYEEVAPQPKIETSDNAFKITLPNVNTEIEMDHTVKCLSNSEQSIVALLSDKDFIKRKDVETELGISQSMAIRILKEMLEKKLLLVDGKGKNTRYFVPGNKNQG